MPCFIVTKTNEYRPNLATGYTWVDSKTLEFDLRKGVSFTMEKNLTQMTSFLHSITYLIQTMAQSQLGMLIGGKMLKA